MFHLPIKNRLQIPGRLTDRQKKILIFLAFFFIILIHHLMWGIVSDDRLNIGQYGSVPLRDIFLSRYETNGRIFTDTLAFIIYRTMPYPVWKLLDSLVWTALAFLIVCLFEGEDAGPDQVLAVCLTLLMYPFQILWSAGYIATTTNYIYTLAALLVSALPCALLLRGKEHVPACVYGLSAAGILYADNHDQYAAALCGWSFLLMIYVLAAENRKRAGGHEARMSLPLRKRLIRNTVLYFLLSASVYVLQMRMPGHSARMNSTVERDLYLPQFAQWSLLKKLYKGYSTTVGTVLFSQTDAAVLFFILLCLCGLCCGSVREKILGAMPLAFHILIKTVGYDRWTIVYDYGYSMPEIGPLSGPKRMKNLFVLLVSLLFVICILSAIWAVVKQTEKKLLILALLLLGAGTRLMMGLSPTLYASGRRTFTLLLLSFIFCCIILYNDLRRQEKPWARPVALAAICTVFIL